MSRKSFFGDLARIKKRLVVGGLVAVAGATALTISRNRGRGERQVAQAAQCAKVAHETIHVVVDAATASGQWIPAVRRLLDLAYCPSRLVITVLADAPETAHLTLHSIAEALGRRYKDEADHVRIVYSPQPTATRRFLWAMQGVDAIHHVHPQYTAGLHAAANVVENWDHLLVVQHRQVTQQWRVQAILSAPLGETVGLGGASGSGIRPGFAAFSYWHPTSGAPVLRVVLGPVSAPPAPPHVGQTAWFCPELCFGLTAHWQYLLTKLAQAGFWKTGIEENADRYRLAVTAFEANAILATPASAIAATRVPVVIPETDLGLWLAPLKLPPPQPNSNPGLAWPLTPAWSLYSGLNPRLHTSTPLAVLGIVNLETASSRMQKNAPNRAWMAKQMMQRYGSVREVERRIQIVQAALGS